MTKACATCSGSFHPEKRSDRYCSEACEKQSVDERRDNSRGLVMPLELLVNCCKFARGKRVQ